MTDMQRDPLPAPRSAEFLLEILKDAVDGAARVDRQDAETYEVRVGGGHVGS
jgi:hypothetical protein